MKFAFYPGCSARSTCKELAVSLQRVAGRLGLDLVELESAPCTGAREIRAVDRDLFLAINALVMARTEALGLPLMTICNTCTLNFLDAKKMLAEDAGARERVAGMLGEHGVVYRGEAEVTHFLWVLLETIGPERIIFGTDSSYFPRGFAEPYLVQQIRDVRELNYREDDIQLIFAGNAARLLKVDL